MWSRTRPAGSADAGEIADRRLLVKVIVGAAAAAALLLAGFVFAADIGAVPQSVIAENADMAPPPPTTNPETTAIGSEPVWQVQCGFGGPTGAACNLIMADISGNLVTSNLTIYVPRAWLARFHDATATDNMRIVAALTRTRYAPPDGPGMESLSVSVDPPFAADLAAVGVSPQRFLTWLYQNVPTTDRPPWVKSASPR